MLAVIAAAYRQ